MVQGQSRSLHSSAIVRPALNMDDAVHLHPLQRYLPPYTAPWSTCSSAMVRSVLDMAIMLMPQCARCFASQGSSTCRVGELQVGVMMSDSMQI